ncbi:MAG TPA: AIR synthase related protein [Candidatus Paceibacterota bacterium]|nr:AIR synthase related protein [Candidatus Paceibacterota bacterium]
MTTNRYDVGYGTLDAFKRLALAKAQETDRNIARLGLKVVEWTQGESVFLVEYSDHFHGQVNENLGTKNDAADRFAEALRTVEEVGKSLSTPKYDNVAQCCAAMVFNDMITLGVLPVTMMMHLVVAQSDWFKWEKRNKELIEGWRRACDLAGTCWGGGETPALRDLIVPGKAVISGSADGIIMPKERLIKRNIQHGDAIIILLESSGIHANGLTLARDIANKLPNGYLTKMPDGRMYGEALLDPTHIYVRYIGECLERGIEIHYCVNITGHGCRKLMRAPEKFTYAIDTVPQVPTALEFIAEHGGVSLRHMYADFNMGGGFALFVPERHVDDALLLLETGEHPFGGIRAGTIFASERSKVVISPIGEKYDKRELQVR